ncbi:MAG: phytanoyl-CoA dioxygenase family protein [Planctomycetaceae bacterium]
MSQYQAYHDQYQTEGYVVLRQFYSAEEINELKREIDRYIAEVVPHLEKGAVFYHDADKPETLKQINGFKEDAWFADFPLQQRWKDLAVALIGEEVTFKSPEWFNKPPATEHPTPPHQDNYYFNLVPCHVCTMWLALDDVDEENGCLRYVPGSHLKPVRPHLKTKVLGFSQGIEDYGDEDYATEVPIIMKPGDLVVHHGNTIHRADANKSDTRHRRSFALVFKGVSCQLDTEGMSRYEQSYKQQHQEMGLK